MKDKKSKIKKGNNAAGAYKSGKWLPYMVFLIALFSGINTLNHDFTLDDEIYYSGNKYVQKGFSGVVDVFTHGSTSGFKEVNKKELYRPVVSLSFILEKELFHNNPHASHFIQVLLYAFACVVLFGLLKQVFNTFNPYIPLLIVLLFVLHPLHTEVVASIKSRDELLAFLFSICCLRQVIQSDRAGEFKSNLMVVLYLLLAFLCKESTVYLLVLVPLTQYFFSSQSRKQIFQSSLISLVVFAGYFFLRNQVIPFDSVNVKPDLINNALIGAHTLFQEYGTAIFIIGFYVLRLFIPYPLSYDYSFNEILLVDNFSWQLILTLFILLALFIYSLILFKKKDPIVYGILFFFISLFPVSNLLLKIDATVGFRFLFTPVLGFSITIVFALIRGMKVNLISNWSSVELKKVCLFFIPVFMLFFVLTLIRNGDWKNNYTLFSNDVKVCPHSARIQSSLAFELTKAGISQSNVQSKKYFLEQAKYHYKECLKIYSSHPDAWHNLALVYFHIGTMDSAKICMYKANEVNPVLKNPLKELGGIYYNAKQNDSALFYFKKVRLIDSADKEANSIISYLENQK